MKNFADQDFKPLVNIIEPDSDNENKGSMEYNVTPSRSGELVQLPEQFVVSEDRIRCECKTNRCPCVNDNKQKYTSLCHLNNKFC
ncbi:unnamed protein product [Brachionus calyciflorus]|uniref:Uncharacterized protein n=1 Tax=Brachionus calyciflorus TaxID=104777 RepID=A0A814AHZ3_9BILA|nr:unnamed protein product [Brachionus calyciflorus]